MTSGDYCADLATGVPSIICIKSRVWLIVLNNYACGVRVLMGTVSGDVGVVNN